MGLRRTRLLATMVAILGLGASACASGSTPINGMRTGVGVRSVTINLTGSQSYSRTINVSGGSVDVRYTGSNTVEQIYGTVSFPGLVSGLATMSINLNAVGGNYSGAVVVSDPSAGIGASVAHNYVPVTLDGDGDASAGATDGSLSLSWSITTVDAPGIEPVYDTLTADEATYCQDAQQRLAGLNPAEVPLGSITDVKHPSRTSFGGSKANLSPLTTQTWQEAGMVTTAGGNTISITHEIFCKTRSADHLATTGVTTAPDLQCSALNQRSLDLAWAQLTPAQQTAYTASGTPLTLGNDVIRQTGIEWLTPLTAYNESGGSASLTSQALLVHWNDPTYQAFPDSIRGVHYCTTWSPAWAYWFYTVGAF